jgi:hypothetical protein
MRIDHVIIGARQIAEVRDLLWEEHGFGAIEGTAHPDGTQGWLVPFDTPDVQYLELLTVGDAATIAGDAFGRLFLERTADGPVFLNWAVLSAGIEGDAARLQTLTGADPGLARGESVRADGRRFPWAEAGFDQSWNCPSRPFFLEYGNWPDRSARVPGDLERARHRVTPTAFDALSVVTPAADLATWWEPYPLPVTVEPGEPDAVRSVRVQTTSGMAEVVL